MISENLRVRLGDAIEKRVSRYIKVYESSFSGVNDVKKFFYFVADVLQQHGYEDDDILAIYDRHKGNYLLGKKYGVTAKMFVDRLLEKEYKMYRTDKKLPASGYRARGDNSPLVMLSLSEMAYMMPFLGNEWKFNMAVDPSRLAYNAELRLLHYSSDGDGMKKTWNVIRLDIPDEAIHSLVKVARDPGFMCLGEDDVFPGEAILDGVDVKVDIRSSVGRFRMESNLFMMTEDDGVIRTASKGYQTGIHIIREVIGKALGQDKGE